MKKQYRYMAAALFLLLCWQVISWIAGEIVIPSPGKVLLLLFSEMQKGRFWQHVGASSLRITAALVISFVLAVPLGLLLGTSKRLDRWMKPLIYLSYPVPKIVLLPLIFLVFGIGDSGKIAMLALILFFQLLITTRDAAREVSVEMKYSLLSLGGGRWDMFRHVIWPSCLPGVFTALRIATGTVVAVLFFVESIGTRFGLGFYILDAWGRADTTQMFVGILLLAGMGVILYESFDIMERVFCRWKKVARS